MYYSGGKAMYNFTYENQGTQTFLVYELRDIDMIDTIGMGMMSNNNILGLATMLYTQLNDLKYIKYNISSKVSLDQFLTGTVKKNRILGMFLSIAESLLALEEYMISIDTVVLEEKYIYLDVTTNKVALINLPIINEKTHKNDCLDFFKKIMYGAQFDQSENCNYVAEIINFLNGSAVFSLQEFKQFIRNLLVDDSNSKVKEKNQQPPSNVTEEKAVSRQGHIDKEKKSPNIYVQPSVPATPVSNQQAPAHSIQDETDNSKDKKKKWSIFGSKKKKEKILPPQVRTPNKPNPTPQLKTQTYEAQVQNTPVSPANYSSVNFGETTVLNDVAAIGETTVLSEGMSPESSPYLVRMKNNEKIKLVKPVFRIGKEKSYVDYFIGDNTAVSRSHANIIIKENEYYVVDTNSTNHTYVNDKLIESNIEVKLTHGSKLRLANEEFEFKIY